MTNWKELISRKVKIDLINGFFYQGIVLSADKKVITIQDKNHNLLMLPSKCILFVREAD